MTIIDRKLPIPNPDEDEDPGTSSAAPRPLEVTGEIGEIQAEVTGNEEETSQSAAPAGSTWPTENVEQTERAVNEALSPAAEDTTTTTEAPPSYGSIVFQRNTANSAANTAGQTDTSRRRPENYDEESQPLLGSRTQSDTSNNPERHDDDDAWSISGWRRNGTYVPLPRKNACQGFLWIVAAVLIASLVLGGIVSTLTGHKKVAPPAPYALPPRMHGRVVEQFISGPIRRRGQDADPRIPFGTLYMQKNIVLDSKALNLSTEGSHGAQQISAFLFHSIGQQLSGLIEVQRANGPWAQYQTSLNSTQASINITAYAYSQDALEAGITIARVETPDAKQAVTVAGRKESDSRRESIVLLVDIGLPLLTGEPRYNTTAAGTGPTPQSGLFPAYKEEGKRDLIDLDISTDAIDILVHDSNIVRPSDPREENFRYRNVRLFSAAGIVKTGVIVSSKDLSIETNRGSITCVGLLRVGETLRITSDAGTATVGIISAHVVQVRLSHGQLLAHLLSANTTIIESDSAGIKGSLLPFGERVEVSTNTGGIELQISWAMMHRFFSRRTQKGATLPAPEPTVRVHSNLGNVALRYQQQPGPMSLRSYVESEVGTVDVTHAELFQGNWTVRTSGAIVAELEIPPSKRVHVDKKNPEGAPLYMEGRVWMKDREDQDDDDDDWDGRRGWGYSLVRTAIAPIRLTL